MPIVPMKEEKEKKKIKKKKKFLYYDVFKAFKHSKIVDLPPFISLQRRTFVPKVFPTYAINTSPDTKKYKRKTTRRRIRL